MNTVLQITLVSGILLAFVSPAAAQTKPTQAEIEQWKKDTRPLLSSPCKKVIWVLEREQKAFSTRQRANRLGLGWWGRGFIEGVLYINGTNEMRKKAEDFGVSAELVAAYISTYCSDHPTETPFDAVQHLLIEVLK